MLLSKNFTRSARHLYNEGFSAYEIARMLRHSVILVVVALILTR